MFKCRQCQSLYDAEQPGVTAMLCATCAQQLRSVLRDMADDPNSHILSSAKVEVVDDYERCRCGGKFFADMTPQLDPFGCEAMGRVVHTFPACKAYRKLDPVAFLAWVKGQRS